MFSILVRHERITSGTELMANITLEPSWLYMLRFYMPSQCGAVLCLITANSTGPHTISKFYHLRLDGSNELFYKYIRLLYSFIIIICCLLLIMGSVSVTLESIFSWTVFVAMLTVISFSCSKVLSFYMVFQSSVILCVEITLTTCPTSIRLLVHQIFYGIIQIHNI